MLWLFEIFAYIGYMYFFVIMSINYEPTMRTIIPLFIYCMYTTWYLYDNVDSILIKNIYSRITLTILYSLFCVFSYYKINTSWEENKNSLIYLFTLSLMPLYYYLAIKGGEYILNCKKYHCIKFPFRFIRKRLKLKRKKINKL